MARKKKKNDSVNMQAEVANPSASVAQEQAQLVPEQKQEVVEEFIPPTLTGEELFKLRAFEAESQTLILEAKILLAERNAFLRKVDPENQLMKWNDQIEQRKEAAKNKKVSYANTMRQIEKRLKISMADYSFDDETGTLIYNK